MDVNSIENLPSSLRFFAGGDTSVRGYDYRSLGPQDENGDFIGGRHLIETSVETDFRFAENWP